jgi:hypothetical protein
MGSQERTSEVKVLITRNGELYQVRDIPEKGLYDFQAWFLEGVEACGHDGEFEFLTEDDLAYLEHDLAQVVKSGASSARGAWQLQVLTRKIELIKEHLCSPTESRQDEGPPTIRPSTCSEMECSLVKYLEVLEEMARDAERRGHQGEREGSS